MNSHVWIGVALLGFFVSGVALSQTTPPQDPAAKKLERLEHDLSDSRSKLEQLASELASTRAQLEGVVRYLDAQSKAAKAMVDTLQSSETAGFVYGINPDSRHVLLKGWREQLLAAQQALPAAPAATAKAEAPKPAEKR